MQTFTGLEYIKIDIANCYGYDKALWDDRIAWTDSVENLYDLAPDADEPALMVKGINALLDAQEGIPTGFISSMDATASGLQIMACLSGCHKTAANVNLIDTGKREDIYQKIGDVMGLDKAIVKKPVMTTFYGSMAQPKSVFGEDTEDLQKFYDALGTELPGAMECMADIQSCWDPEASEYSWTLPDGHVANMRVMVTEEKKIEVDELDHMTFTYRAEINKPVKKGISLAANIIHSIDGWIVREMYRRAAKQGFDIVTIHDSFWCSPNYMNELRENYINILADLARMDLLQSILREVTSTGLHHMKKSTDLASKILKCEYALS